MGDVLGTEDERARRSLYRLLTDFERQLSLEDPKTLVLAMVHMQRSLAFRIEHLDEGVAPVGFLARGLYGSQAAEPPPRLSFASLEPVGPLGSDAFVPWLPFSPFLTGLVPRRCTDDLAPVPGLEDREAFRLGLVGRVVLVRRVLRLGWRQGACLGRLADGLDEALETRGREQNSSLAGPESTV